ncbi:MAG TPA: hypothetical protein VGM88_00660 [Kofleriaceae bacterium]
MRVALIVLALASCHVGGEYATGGRDMSGVDKGETNGRMFDFVSNKPDGDDWQIRIRGSGMWVSYARDSSTDALGSVNLSAKETRHLWKLVDELDMTAREQGAKDEKKGYLMLQLREPGEEQHDIFKVFVSRKTKDDDILALAEYLQDLVEKYKKERPNF